MIRIALLDPHPVVHKGFKSFFKKTPHIVLEKAFQKGEALFDFLVDNPIDIVWLDRKHEYSTTKLKTDIYRTFTTFGDHYD